jgi:hypothetical protein
MHTVLPNFHIVTTITTTITTITATTTTNIIIISMCPHTTVTFQEITSKHCDQIIRGKKYRNLYL